MSLFIDHVVITVNDLDKSIKFYTEVLGMELQEFLSNPDNIKRKSLKFGNQKINLHENIKPFKPHAKNPTPGSMDICFVSDKSLGDWLNALKKLCVNIEEGPVLKTGANSPIESIYIRDPDNNLIEISNKIKQ